MIHQVVDLQQAVDNVVEDGSFHYGGLNARGDIIRHAWLCRGCVRLRDCNIHGDRLETAYQCLSFACIPFQISARTITERRAGLIRRGQGPGVRVWFDSPLPSCKSGGLKKTKGKEGNKKHLWIFRKGLTRCRSSESWPGLSVMYANILGHKLALNKRSRDNASYWRDFGTLWALVFGCAIKQQPLMVADLSAPIGIEMF